MLFKPSKEQQLLNDQQSQHSALMTPSGLSHVADPETAAMRLKQLQSDQFRASLVAIDIVIGFFGACAIWALYQEMANGQWSSLTLLGMALSVGLPVYFRIMLRRVETIAKTGQCLRKTGHFLKGRTHRGTTEGTVQIDDMLYHLDPVSVRLPVPWGQAAECLVYRDPKTDRCALIGIAEFIIPIKSQSAA